MTLNILTLGGVAVAIGRLVDDSIVVIEKHFPENAAGEDFSRIGDGCNERGGSGNHSFNLTRLVAVFLPVALLNGGLQEFLLPFCFDCHLFFAGFINCGIDGCSVNERRIAEKDGAAKTFDRPSVLRSWLLGH